MATHLSSVPRRPNPPVDPGVGRFAEASEAHRERERLAAVAHYDILDTPPDGAFDRITALAARFFHVPIAIVSIVDQDRIWFKSRHGLEATEIPRHPGLCASAILGSGPYLLPDARADPVALTNPLVAGEFGLRFYAAAPLVTKDGHNLGTLCVIDKEPRTLTETEVEALADFAALVVGELDLRLEARRVITEHNELRERSLAQKHETDTLARVLQASLLPPRLPSIPGLELAGCYRPTNGGVVGGDFYDVFPLPRRAWALALGDVCGKGPRAAAVTAAVRYAVRAGAMEHDSPTDVLGVLNETMLIDQEDEPKFCTLVYGRLRRSGKAFSLTLASGGHPLPHVLRRNGSIERVGEYGTLVGCLAEVHFTDVTVTLRPGDAVVFYTDGLVEAAVGENMLGVDGITDVLASCGGRSATGIAGCLQDAVLKSGHPQRDDLAILVVKVREDRNATGDRSLRLRDRRPGKGKARAGRSAAGALNPLVRAKENTMPEMDQTEGQDAAETEMCCDGKKTAEEHRHESADGKCCIDK